MERQINCPECNSTHTLPIPETMWERMCCDCDADWDIRSREELAHDLI